jgi:hypothetical protein
MNNTKKRTLVSVIALVAAAVLLTGIHLATIQEASAAVKCKAKGESTLNCQSNEQQATLTQEQTVSGNNSSASATGSISQSASNSVQ